MDELVLVTKWNLMNREVQFCALNDEAKNLENKLDDILGQEMKHIVRKSNRYASMHLRCNLTPYHLV